MWFIYVSLCLGIIIGALNKNMSKFIKINDILTVICIFLLLFLMGLSIGTNKEVINNIGEVGLVALAYSLLTILGSITIVYFITNFIFRGIKK